MQLFRHRPKPSPTSRDDGANRQLPPSTSPAQQRTTTDNLVELQAISVPIESPVPKESQAPAEFWRRLKNPRHWRHNANNGPSSSLRLLEDADMNGSGTWQTSTHNAGVVQCDALTEVEAHHESTAIYNMHITSGTQESYDQALTEPPQQGGISLDQTQHIWPAERSSQATSAENHEERDTITTSEPPASSVHPALGLTATSVSEPSTSHTLSPTRSPGPSRGLSSNFSAAVSQASSQTTTDVVDQATSSTISPAVQQQSSQALIQSTWVAAWPHIKSFQLGKDQPPVYYCTIPDMNRSIVDALRIVCMDALNSDRRTREIKTLLYLPYLCGSGRDCIPRQTLVVHGPRDRRKAIERVFETDDRIRAHRISYDFDLLYVPKGLAISAMSYEEYMRFMVFSWRLVVLVVQYWYSKEGAAEFASLLMRQNGDGMLAQRLEMATITSSTEIP